MTGSRNVRILLAFAAAQLLQPIETAAVDPNSTFCNPINVERGMADPCLVVYKNEYYLFATGAGGYYYSSDFVSWTRVSSHVGGTAPGVAVWGDTMFLTSSAGGAFYYTTNPKSGSWREVRVEYNMGDPALYFEDDGRMVAVYGMSFAGYIRGVELDRGRGFEPVSTDSWIMAGGDWTARGWERPGDNNEIDGWPCIEGGWLFKHNGVYYANYATPGTEYKSYSDGVYTSTSLRGPYTYAPYSPFSHKPTGFMPSAGHGCTFTERTGTVWRAVTMLVSPMWNRRVGLIPVGFDSDNVMHALTYLGDYPQYLPGRNPASGDSNLVGWMHLSFGKQSGGSTNSSSTYLAFDENIRTSWNGGSSSGAWLQVDIGTQATLNAAQVNFNSFSSHRYVVEVSPDGQSWSTAIDRSGNSRTVGHDYVQITSPVRGRYVRLTNRGSTSFTIVDFRVFGNADGTPPAEVNSVTVARHADDMGARVQWPASSGAHGYVIRYGIAPDKLYNNYEVRSGNSYEIRSLNAGVEYYFTVDAFNDVGIAKGRETVLCTPSPTLSRGRAVYRIAEVTGGDAAPRAFALHGRLLENRTFDGGLDRASFAPEKGRVAPGLYVIGATAARAVLLPTLIRR